MEGVPATNQWDTYRTGGHARTTQEGQILKLLSEYM